jgi:hypothetical protein
VIGQASFTGATYLRSEPTFDQRGKYTGSLLGSGGHKNHAPLVGHKLLNRFKASQCVSKCFKVFQTHGSSDYPAIMNEDFAAMTREEYDSSSSEGVNLERKCLKEGELSPDGAGVRSRTPPSFKIWHQHHLPMGTLPFQPPSFQPLSLLTNSLLRDQWLAMMMKMASGDPNGARAFVVLEDLAESRPLVNGENSATAKVYARRGDGHPIKVRSLPARAVVTPVLNTSLSSGRLLGIGIHESS